MAESWSYLTASGLLYEGNFAHWRDTISAAFIAKGRPAQAYPSIAITSPDGHTTVYHESSIGDIQDLLSSISPALLARVPLNVGAQVGKLYAHLEKLCEPFRILDLPPELRNRVYEEAVHSHEPQSVQMDYYRNGNRHRIPGLAQATRQLRQEVLPIFFSASTFLLQAAGKDSAATSKSLAVWEEKVLSGNSKFLRQMSLSIPVSSDWFLPPRRSIHLRFSETRGLWIEFPSDLRAEGTKTLEDEVGKVEVERKAKSQPGQSILAALHRLCTMEVPHPAQGGLLRVPRHNWLNLRIENEEDEL